jgi:hypothetical protein
MSTFLEPSPKPIIELLEPKIRKRFKDGRGSGAGKSYKPFLEVRDVPSKGRVHRRPAITHGRIVHLLSDLELAAFLLFDWASIVVDIREQYPLDIETTLEISERIGIKHPAYAGVDQVMTTDLVVDLKVDGQIITHAISAKYANDLEDKRVIEKQELERRYWEGKGIPWFIFTEQEVPRNLVQNIKWLIPHLHSFDLDKKQQEAAFETVCHALQSYPSNKIANVMLLLDENKGVERGTYLSYLRHLLAQQAIYWDMSNINHRSLRTNDLKISEHWLQGAIAYVHAK